MKETTADYDELTKMQIAAIVEGIQTGKPVLAVVIDREQDSCGVVKSEFGLDDFDVAITSILGAYLHHRVDLDKWKETPLLVKATYAKHVLEQFLQPAAMIVLETVMETGGFLPEHSVKTSAKRED